MARGIGSGKTVVVVNDSPDLLDLAETVLREDDFDVKVAVLGDGAFELIRDTRPDGVILDVRLPDVSGWDILQAVKLDQQTAHIPVLVCSAAVAELRSLEKQLERMGVDVLIKPFAIDALITKVRQMMKQVFGFLGRIVYDTHVGSEAPARERRIAMSSGLRAGQAEHSEGAWTS